MLHEGMSFSNWDIALETISTIAKQNGFAIKKEHVEYCPDGTVKKRTLSLNPHSIKQALEKEFSDHPIYAQDLHLILQQYRLIQKSELANNTFLLYNKLIKKKEQCPEWYIAIE
ncbi:35070_t:CDS:2 [Gigaspora margarita]|uniref:35070_t:CDS:1 n=1 Tax=Gigaspora margarita TaxID=4874 RepID=A0ABN7W1Y2_GIGMA|nr:35070_t:CDS:2 [Gigaspora margarita]